MIVNTLFKIARMEISNQRRGDTYRKVYFKNNYFTDAKKLREKRSLPYLCYCKQEEKRKQEVEKTPSGLIDALTNIRRSS